MKKFVELMKKDFQGECFTKEEVVFFGVIMPILLVFAMCIAELIVPTF